MPALEIINNPRHYVENRKIQPIEVIEDWSLCHHLACVVKYIARTARKDDTWKDLKKAEWYLKRELIRYQNKFNKCHFSLVDPYPLSLDSVLKDWALPLNLEETLFHLTVAKKQDMKKTSLIQALKCLQSEIQKHGKDEL